jgi:hypothetical protein
MEDEEVAWCGKTGKKSVFASGDETRFGRWLEVRRLVGRGNVGVGGAGDTERCDDRVGVDGSMVWEKEDQGVGWDWDGLEDETNIRV